jgi:hypothetical protein
VKKTFEVTADPGKELSFEQLERFVQQARAEGAGQIGTQVKAKVRFNGTLRALSVDVHGEAILGQRTDDAS